MSDSVHRNLSGSYLRGQTEALFVCPLHRYRLRGVSRLSVWMHRYNYITRVSRSPFDAPRVPLHHPAPPSVIGWVAPHLRNAISRRLFRISGPVTTWFGYPTKVSNGATEPAISFHENWRPTSDGLESTNTFPYLERRLKQYFQLFLWYLQAPSSHIKEFRASFVVWYYVEVCFIARVRLITRLQLKARLLKARLKA
jgi:hypothetical protein